MPEGRFIVLEGLDGAGITTQTEYLRTWCEKNRIPVSVTKEPTDGPAGGLIKWVLRRELVGLRGEALALLFAADRQHHVASEIAPALSCGATVICDRYYLSSFAYQLVEVDNLTWLREINSNCPTPDLIIYLDLPAEKCFERMHSDAWRGADQLQLYEEIARLTQVRNNFLSIIPLLQEDGHCIVVVDGARDIKDVFRAVIAPVTKIIDQPRQSRRGSPRNTGSEQIAAILEGEALTG